MASHCLLQTAYMYEHAASLLRNVMSQKGLCRARAEFCDLGSLECAVREERLSMDLVRVCC